MHMQSAIAAKGMLSEQFTQLWASVAELEGAVIENIETVADLNVEMKASKKWADDVVYKINGLQAPLVQLKKGWNKNGESITHFQSVIDRSSAGLNDDRECSKRRNDEEDCKILAQLETCLTELVDEAQQIHFRAAQYMTRWYTFGWVRLLQDFQRKLAFDVSVPVVLADDLEELLSRLNCWINFGCLAEIGHTDGFEMRSSGADDPAVDDSETDKAGNDNLHNLKHDCLLLNSVV